MKRKRKWKEKEYQEEKEEEEERANYVYKSQVVEEILIPCEGSSARGEVRLGQVRLGQVRLGQVMYCCPFLGDGHNADDGVDCVDGVVK